jgi:dTDP-glucose pyrophosphorylase
MQIFEDIAELCILKEAPSIRDVLTSIESGGLQICLFLDVSGNLRGIMTDGDVRRAILEGATLESQANEFVNTNPVCIERQSESLASAAAKHQTVNHVLVGGVGRPVKGLYSKIAKPSKELPDAFIMAGGKGERLRPITNTTPKPLVEVGGVPIIHRLLKDLVDKNCKKVFISVNYLADQIVDSVGDGSDFGLQVHYLFEETPLGTAGSLSLLNSQSDSEQLIVLNADLMVNPDYQALVASHRTSMSAITLAVREHFTQIPFGVIHLENDTVRAIEEKPSLGHLVAAGIYVLEREIVNSIRTEHLDMPELIEKTINEGKKVSVHQLFHGWIDVGRPEDLKRANESVAGEK